MGTRSSGDDVRGGADIEDAWRVSLPSPSAFKSGEGGLVGEGGGEGGLMRTPGELVSLRSQRSNLVKGGWGSGGRLMTTDELVSLRRQRSNLVKGGWGVRWGGQRTS